MTSPPLWCWPDLCRACGVEPVSGPDVTGIGIDTRTLEPGDLFIALSGDPGPRFHSSGSGGRDGHDFVGAAAAAGAAGLMVSREVVSTLPRLVVRDTLDGLWALGRAARVRMAGKVAAVTGSSGKTTARQWLQELLGAQAKTHASRGSLNNHWGVPLSLARMPSQSDYGVFEIGTNNAGEIAPLAELVEPDAALVLNVLPAHLGRFDDMEALRREKLSIARGLREGGTLVLPATLPHDEVVCDRLVTFGLDEDADVRATVKTAGHGMAITTTIGSRRWTWHMQTIGEHRARTSVAVFAMLYALDANLDDALDAFPSLTTPPGRGNVIRVGDVAVIDDSYNANPVSVRYALEALGGMPGQRIAILGEMLELGEGGKAMHDDIASACTALDGVVTVGSGFAGWHHGLGDRYWGHADTAADIGLEELLARLEPGANILVKGANKVFWVNGFVDDLCRRLRQERA